MTRSRWCRRGPKKWRGESKDEYKIRRDEFAPIRDAAELALQAWEYRRVKDAHTIKVAFLGKSIRLFNAERLVNAYRLSKQGVGCLRAGNFSQDSVGDWYLNVTVDRVELPLAPLHGPDSSVGLDPGQITAMTGSDGSHYIPNETGNIEPNDIPSLQSGRYRAMEPKIQQAQQRGHKKQAKRLHRTARRQRKNDRDKFCKQIVMQYSHIWIGNLNVRKMARSRLRGQAKSILDAGIGLASATLKSLGPVLTRCIGLCRCKSIVNAYNTGPVGLFKRLTSVIPRAGVLSA